ncbi:putative ABC/TRAP transporter component (periplasmic binding protein-like I) [Bradyrhizobium sp. ORS 285]|uniref:ABC transporter substrate-binding protein n=1 Tax=Bradyrhizobium sp. ORS 285 TaxID=115808 RepID=UPI0002407282|nr:ABC transporter substrate-binding protein [Bradyrhizobium sp. ORS 285]CCD84372.1 putative ABC/TRAP transporter component (periplasmic binding protein-like I) [Bradyrhizobium sp. ORS 285]SMX57015.1 putative ABC/TRAP transporter component (periplasmic binding protein-like I) [Bradyrhizobium sp. ORS 285]
MRQGIEAAIRACLAAAPCQDFRQHYHHGSWLRDVVKLPCLAVTIVVASLLVQSRPSSAADSEIRIGNTMPYSGPALAYGIIGKTIAAYFNKVNAEGGINGRRINFISYDDGYAPSRTVEMTRKLVEEDKVLLMFAGLGTAPNLAVRPYLNANKIPQLFVASGSSQWDQPHDFPWTMGFQPSYQAEAHVYAQYLLETHSRGKIAILSQDDDFGKDYVKGLKDGLGGKLPIVAEATYKVTDANVNQQIATLKASGADIFFDVTTPKFAAMAIRRAAEIGWRPDHIISTVSESVSAVMQPAGLQNAEGILSAGYYYEGEEAAAAGDPSYREWSAFMDRYLPDIPRTNGLATFGYIAAHAMVAVLKNCGDDLSRENIMKQAASLKGVRLPMLTPGITVNTSAHDYAPLEQMQMMQFTGGKWQRFGPVRSGIDPGSVSDSFKTIFRYGTAKRDLANQLNANTVTLMTGSVGSTYANMGSDLASALDKGTELRILPVMGRGSVQSVADILLLRGVDAGIIRKDTLAFLERKDFANNVREQLAYVAKLFNEEMHVLAPKSVTSLSDLDGKTIAVDLPDGGTFVTSINVFERLGIRPHLLYIEPRLALDMLQRGDIDAIIAVEGKPLQWLSQVNDRNLHLVPVDYDKALHEDYLPAKLSAEDYPNLISGSAPVNTIAAEAVLASFNWQPGSDRHRRLSLLVEALFNNLPALQRPPYHPKWLEVAPLAPIAGWTRFKTAQDWLDRNMPAAQVMGANAQADDLQANTTADPKLFREFMAWRANRQKRPAAHQPQ